MLSTVLHCEPVRRVACLIINWNGTEDTVALLHSLFAQSSDRLELTVFLVDNGSTDVQRNALRAGIQNCAWATSVVGIQNERNIGIPSAYNQAIARAGLAYDYYLRLDNDVVLLGGAVVAMVELLEAERRNGARLVGGNVRYFDRPSENNGGAVTIDLLCGRTSVEYPAENRLCDGILGCVMLIDGEVARVYGPSVFHGWLFMTTDESELSLRCAQRGWRTVYASRTIALHKSGRSTRKVPALATRYSCRNWSYLAMKYVKPPRARVAVGLRLAATVLLLVAKLKWANAAAIAVGLAAALNGVKRD